MRLIYIHQHFTTNRGSTGTRSYDVAKYMVEAGHEVYMICGVNEASDIQPLPWYKWFRQENMDGIEVITCNVPYANNFGKFKRTWAFVWFAVLAAWAALRVKKPEVVFATSTPLTVGIPGRIAAKMKKVPFVFEVRDLWPESFVHSGWLTEKDLYVRLMARLESYCYKHAQKILLVSKAFETRLIERGLEPAKLKTVLLGADGNLFKDPTPDKEFVAQYHLEGKTIAIFTGAHGKANGLDYVVDAAKFTNDREDIAYVMIGSGSEKERLKQRAKDEGLSNVVFADPVPKQRLVGVLASCHIGLMILKYIEGGRPVTPNKIFDYMFIGIPSIVNFEGPTIDIVRKDQSGLYADGTKSQELAEQVIKLADNPHLREEMGNNGKKAAWEKYDRKGLAYELIDVFEEVAARQENK
jgi:glycosyltransferase involved in cell wall biosynthesis